MKYLFHILGTKGYNLVESGNPSVGDTTKINKENEAMNE